jgi:hypothetical protein
VSAVEGPVWAEVDGPAEVDGWSKKKDVDKDEEETKTKIFYVQPAA